MAKVQFHLPGNRGVLKGPEGLAIANEQRRQQVAEQPRLEGLHISNMRASTAWASVLGPTAGTTLFIEALPFEHITRVKYAQVNITNGVAGARVYAALYRLSFEPGIVLRQIPGTRAVFDATNTGRQMVQTEKEVDIYPHQHLYIGKTKDNALVRLAGVNSGGVVPPIGKLHYDDPAVTVLPTVAQGTYLHIDDAHDDAGICFLSERGKLLC